MEQNEKKTLIGMVPLWYILSNWQYISMQYERLENQFNCWFWNQEKNVFFSLFKFECMRFGVTIVIVYFQETLFIYLVYGLCIDSINCSETQYATKAFYNVFVFFCHDIFSQFCKTLKNLTYCTNWISLFRIIWNDFYYS